MNTLPSKLENLSTDPEVVFKQLYLEYRESCCQWLQNNYNVSQSNSADLFQQAILILYDNIRMKKVSFDGVASIKTYLYGIAKKLALSKLRTVKKWTEVNEPEQIFDMLIVSDKLDNSYSDDQKTKILILRKSLESIGHACKQLLTLFYYHSMKMQEIAEKLDYSNASTAKAQKYKCLKRLKKSVLISHG